VRRRRPGVFAEASLGPFTMQYRRTSDGRIIRLHTNRFPALDVVRLTWTGDQPSDDVERATRPDFSDGQVIAPGVQGTPNDDATLSDGRTWFYRVR